MSGLDKLVGSQYAAEMSDPGFGVYVHWPFCAAKCPYCDFNSHVRHGGWDETAYLDAYTSELDELAARLGARRTRSIFFGGGTPSLMRPDTVAAIIASIDRHWPIAPDGEITLEANPGSVEADRFAGYRRAGVNRVSIGVQALDDAALRTLGRIHSVAEARRAVDIGLATFERVSFDLIYARPGQTEADWRAELATALATGVSHLSLYQLTIEPATPFERLWRAGKLQVPDDGAAADLFALTEAMTAAAGLSAYEISNHARAGEESRHNLLYWRYGEYAGIGPGAHGRIAVGGIRHATMTERNPERWLERVGDSGHGRVEDTGLDRRQCADEALLMGMRLAEGLPLSRLDSIAGLAPSRACLDDLTALGLIERPVGDVVRATAAGRLVLNEVIRQLSRSLEPVGVENAMFQA